METQSFDNVWDALEDTAAEAVSMTMRSDLLIAVDQRVRSWNISQADAARRLGITQPHLNDLLHGKIDKFGLDTLINLATQAGLSVRTDIAQAGDGEAMDLTPSMMWVLEAAAGIVAGGSGVAVMATDGDLSSQQAADVLGVSRQYMVRLLDRGDIPSFRVGSHRRVKAEDLATYRARRDHNRHRALAALTSDAQALGAYDAPAKFGPRRRGNEE